MLYLIAGLALDPAGLAVLTPGPLAEQIMAVTLAAVTVSIVLHGISVRPIIPETAVDRFVEDLSH